MRSTGGHTRWSRLEAGARLANGWPRRGDPRPVIVNSPPGSWPADAGFERGPGPSAAAMAAAEAQAMIDDGYRRRVRGW